MILAELPDPASGGGGLRVLDVGCGAGNLLRQMLERGYHADGVIPAPALATAVRERVRDWTGYQPRIFECRFEDLPLEECRGRYDVVLFSESFQYVLLDASLPLSAAVLRPGGTLLISDFFRSEADGDGGPGDRSFGGGHPLRDFRARMAEAPIRAPLWTATSPARRAATSSS
jgi:SAM-dependent methyltransferase